MSPARTLSTTLVTVCLLLPGVASADAKMWLDRMSHAMQNLNYRGTFVYLHGSEIESMRIEHSRDETGERERLLSLNGEAREVIRDNNNVTCIWPGSKSVTVSKSRPRKPFPAALPNIAELEMQYRFRSLGEERVAGKLSRVIAVEPRDSFRYGYKLWLDRESSLLLRSDLLDEMKRPIEQVMFTELEVLDHIPAEHFAPTLSGTDYTWVEEANSSMQPDLMWKVSALPAGFELTSRYKKPMPPHDNAVEHMVFSDGLASVSLFIEPIKASESKLIGGSSMGGINVFGVVQDDYQITVVGEVPAETVEYIAKAVVHLN